MQKMAERGGTAGVTMGASAIPIVLALCLSHFLNDLVQALLPAIYPIIKETYALDFGQIGLITLAFQMTASVLQPFVGVLTDRRPQPFSLTVGMGMTLCGLLLLAQAGSFTTLLAGAALIGTGSAIFHPESTRMARLASGGRHGLAQSLFQVGGQAGQAVGPLLAALIIVPRGQASLTWFSALALVAMAILFRVGRWYQRNIPPPAPTGEQQKAEAGLARARHVPPVRGGALFAVGVLFILMLSKSAYTASLTSYYTFFLIEKFDVSVQTSQVLLFLFLVAQALGSLIGGYLGDRLGRRWIIWFSILGALPFTMLLPHASLAWTIVLTIIIGGIMASAFPAIIVYALELLPGRVGVVAGLFYGVSFGLGALSAAALGEIADLTSIETVYALCAYLPLLGLMAWFLPGVERR